MRNWNPLERENDTADKRFLVPIWLAETPYWAISAVVHLILALIVGTIVLIDRVKVHATRFTPPPIRTVPDIPWELPPATKYTPPTQEPVKDSIVPVIPVIPPADPRGEEKNPNKDLDSAAANDAIGVLGPTSGIAGPPGIGPPSTGVGPRPPGLNAVNAALDWLARHQHADGYWSGSDFKEQCADPGKPCRHDEERSGPAFTDGSGFEGYDVGVTALALLAFTGNGHTHVTGNREFRPVVRKAMDWLLEQQQHDADPSLDGVIGRTDADEWVYNHAIATMALAELLVGSRDKFGGLPKAVAAGTEYILRAQNDGYGWKYGFHDGKNDTSVTGWMVLALKNAKACAKSRLIGTDLKRFAPAFAGALEWLRRSTSKASGITGYMAPGDPGSQLQGSYPEVYPYSKNLSCMTGVSLLCRLLAGERRGDSSVKSAVRVLLANLPQWTPYQSKKRRSTINLYYWYYGSYALYQHGGKAWRDWNGAMLESLLQTQRVRGCGRGSWDPVGEWGAAGGRVYATAIGAMTLEVYYRYRRTHEGRGGL